ncbi:MAG: T9SS type A sorting domain-containing protein [Ignavibacteria bacterium]|nr:T9SS type A sorting domain-containing protein [Ignavibacteria bacterium]
MNKLFIIVMLLGLLNIAYSQDYIRNCPHSAFIEGKSSPQDVIGGLYKPQRTNVSGAPTNASFKILLVFVQFANETAEVDYWPIGGAPVFKDEILAQNINTTGNYWDRYNEKSECLSDWFQEVSKGQMHVTGKAYNIILDYNANYYLNYSTDPDIRMRYMNDEIFNKLTSAGVRWQQYDYWSGANGNFNYQPDNYVDMIVKVHRTKTVDGLFHNNASGYAFLGYSTYSGIDIPVPGGKYIHDGFGTSIGSGVTIVGTAGGPASKDYVFNVAKHEYGHYLFGAGHTGTGVGIMGGGDIYLSAWESKKLGYLNTRIIDFSTPAQTLGDISSRSSSGEILQVPINGAAEYFMIENRRQVSHYDRTMLGDTTRGIWDRVLYKYSDYGKGVYIYHHHQDMNFPGDNDLECADGLWDWTITGTTTPDWSNEQILNIYERTGIPVPLHNDDCGASTHNKDGRTVGHFEENDKFSYDAWFGTGKRHTTLGGEATDRIFTFDKEYWTSRELAGDRWDAFNLGYNEMFSPYSNPSTINWDNNQSGIFIYYNALNGNDASINIYKVGQNNWSEDQILAATPPSKPMGITIHKTICINEKTYPRILWNHKTEPDMIPAENYPYKRYKIFRAVSDMNNIPVDYIEIADISIHKDVNPDYIDYNTYGNCENGSSSSNDYRVRYRVKAVDKTNWASVYSDFVSIVTRNLNQNGSDDGDNIKPAADIPNTYKLSQNYPNPFNPTTNISYDIPKDGFVTLKIYDVAGREIKTLVNGFINAGSYIMGFNGISLSSGVYYYRLIAGSFVQTKRMVLIK